MGSQPLVSVIVPVYNHADCLKICLEHLAQQTYLAIEVIVVDNGSDCFADIQNLVARFPFAELFTESIPGSYAARNRGIAEAKGEVIAFTDADCIPAIDWVEQGVRQLQENPDCGLVAGAINIVMKNPDHPVELFESVKGLRQQQFLERDHYGATANVFTRPDVLKKVGVFNAALKSSGDVDWGQRVFAAGYRQIYADSVCIDHPARSSFAEISRQASRHAGGFYDLRCRHNPSVIKRNVIYFLMLASQFAAPVLFACRCVCNPKLKTPVQVAKVVLTFGFVRWVTAKTLLQLKFGGISERQ